MAKEPKTKRIRFVPKFCELNVAEPGLPISDNIEEDSVGLLSLRQEILNCHCEFKYLGEKFKTRVHRFLKAVLDLNTQQKVCCSFLSEHCSKNTQTCSELSQ